MEFLKQYEILFKKARTDLKVAKNIFEDFENETASFHTAFDVKEQVLFCLGYAWLFVKFSTHFHLVKGYCLK